MKNLKKNKKVQNLRADSKKATSMIIQISMWSYVNWNSQKIMAATIISTEIVFVIQKISEAVLWALHRSEILKYILCKTSPMQFQLRNAFEVPCDTALGHDLGLEKPELVDVSFRWGFVYHGLRHFVLLRICGLWGHSIYLTSLFWWKCLNFLGNRDFIVDSWCPLERLIFLDNSFPQCHYPFDFPMVTGSQGRAKCILLL